VFLGFRNIGWVDDEHGGQGHEDHTEGSRHEHFPDVVNFLLGEGERDVLYN
jgi:hypothetical protein